MRHNLIKRLMIISFLGTFLIGSYSQPTDGIRVLAYYLGPADPIEKYDVRQMTHIIFCFGQIKGNRFSLTKNDSSVIKKMVSLKSVNPQLEVILSLGGGRGCKTCSDAFSTEQGRIEFAQSISETHRYFGTDGLDLDWEFPTVEHFVDQKYSPADKVNFTKLVETIRKYNPGKELSFAAGAHEGIFEEVVEWEKVMKMMDYVNLMTYDIGSYQNRPDLPQYRHLALGDDAKITYHHTALYSTPDKLHAISGKYAQFKTPGQERSVDWCVKYLLKMGIPSSKIIVGAAFYGRAYEDVSYLNDGLYMPGTYKGGVSFKNFQAELSPDSGFVYHWDSIAQAPWMYNREKRIFVTFDDKKSVELKTKYVIDNNLGGIMFWQLGSDSFRNGLLDVIDRTKRNYKK
ncbi:MAG TPA: glycosyl hydrolase family 18 protein [Bacteroidales bacterium]|nr:glycosyl hydrolase family 18 protein [Bacteroidales bacterium]